MTRYFILRMMMLRRIKGPSTVPCHTKWHVLVLTIFPLVFEHALPTWTVTVHIYIEPVSLTLSADLEGSSEGGLKQFPVLLET